MYIITTLLNCILCRKNIEIYIYMLQINVTVHLIPIVSNNFKLCLVEKKNTEIVSKDFV